MNKSETYIRQLLKKDDALRQLGKYKVLEMLGRGGMGAVYRCLDCVGGVEVAVKMIPAELLSRASVMEELKANFQLTSTLIHQNIAACLNLERADSGHYYMVMELVRGKELSQLMRERRKAGGMSLEEALPILHQVAIALDYAHNRGIMHRDVKPGNIMVSDDGTVKVLDFGLAARIPKDASQVPVDVRAISGTPMYMPPEQWLGQPQGAATDQYELAVTAYEMLAGHLPFDSSDSTVLRNMVINVEVPVIETLSSQVNSVLARGMAKKPGERFASCEEFVCALEDGMRQKEGRKGSASSGGIKVTIALLFLLLVLAWMRFAQLRSRKITGKVSENDAQTILGEPKIENTMQMEGAGQEGLADAGISSSETGTVTGMPTAEVASADSGVATFAEAPVVSDDKTYLFVNLATGKWGYSKESPNVEDDRCRTVELWFRRVTPGRSLDGGKTQPHKVSLTSDYYIGIFEVTKAQWVLSMAGTSSGQEEDMCPMVGVSYNDIRGMSSGAGWPDGGHTVDADSFLGKVRAKTPLEFDLPTVAQWEYACRAGEMKDLCPDLNRMAWYSGNAENGAHRVGTRCPNAWGLYDMYGNASEICLDWYVRGWVSGDKDPSGPPRGQDNMRCVCGTNWTDEENRNRPTWRKGQTAETADDRTGLRLVAKPPALKAGVGDN